MRCTDMAIKDKLIRGENVDREETQCMGYLNSKLNSKLAKGRYYTITYTVIRTHTTLQ